MEMYDNSLFNFGYSIPFSLFSIQIFAVLSSFLFSNFFCNQIFCFERKTHRYSLIGISRFSIHVNFHAMEIITKILKRRNLCVLVNCVGFFIYHIWMYVMQVTKNIFFSFYFLSSTEFYKRIHN